MHKILLENIIFYAHHGVHEEETIMGGNFEINLEVETDFSKAATSDDIEGTVNYVALYKLIEEEVKIPSKLLEHLGGRIIQRLKKEFPNLHKTTLKISKLNPPIAGEIEKVSILIEA